MRVEPAAVAGSYDPTESLFSSLSAAQSPPMSSRLVVDGEFSEESWLQRSNSAKFASSFPGGGFDLTAVKNVSGGDSAATTDMKKLAAVSGNGIRVFQLLNYLNLNIGSN